MPPMRARSLSKALAVAVLALLAGPVQAQKRPAASPPTPVSPRPVIDVGRADAPSDTLLDALTCRTSIVDIAGLLPKLRRERPDEFVQTERQYVAPVMDLYRLAEPVRAWGHQSDAIVLTANRVLLLVDGPLEQAAAQLEHELERTRDAPLAGALDDQHALVIYAGEQPGLENRTLIGCEYRIAELSLLDDPRDAWRKPSP